MIATSSRKGGRRRSVRRAGSVRRRACGGGGEAAEAAAAERAGLKTQLSAAAAAARAAAATHHASEAALLSALTGADEARLAAGRCTGGTRRHDAAARLLMREVGAMEEEVEVQAGRIEAASEALRRQTSSGEADQLERTLLAAQALAGRRWTGRRSATSSSSCAANGGRWRPPTRAARRVQSRWLR